ncbi:MAG: NADPH-dependent assimilatory sulfite reductase hemoprotein subunit [Candidatus Sumerlaeia bacterium]|nr:NADPH-dependent assimilatory sulfite reductase hemoprotein subunit [Candidatus Sumerlaeia bacterium]
MADQQYSDPEVIRREQGIDAPLEKKSKVEQLKLSSKGLRGNVLEEMLDESTPNVSNDSYQLMKHFGMYQQDNRDTRIERKRAGLEKDYSFMIRTKVPGGILSAEQYLLLDELAENFSTFKSIRLTTRQTIQFHGVGKHQLQGFVRGLNTRLLTSYGACGDVVRNTMFCPVADIDADPALRGREVFWELGRQISDRTLPRTNSYYDIFIDGEKDDSLSPKFELRSEAEDLYGENYMPRKFKIGITVPEDNCIDVYTQDLGLVAMFDEKRKLQGYNILAGGGLGHSHAKKDSYPRVASPIGFVGPDKIMAAVDGVITIQRDYGNRLDRKRARLKYLLDEVGTDWFHKELARRVGSGIEAYREIDPAAWKAEDHLGWHDQLQPGLHYVGIFIENGRIEDRKGFKMRTALRKVIDKYRPQVRITGQQNIILANIPTKNKRTINSMLLKAGFDLGTEDKLSELRRWEMSCVALPTCGLALAEAERAMPVLITQLEERGFGNESIVMRMSGCPNSCSRAPVAEIGLIGRAPQKYNIYTGGDFEGLRLNELFKENVPFDDLADEIAALFKRWHAERNEGEAFGDWSHRVGVEALKG